MTYPNRTSESPLCVFYTVSQVVTWLQGPGSELLKTQQEIGDSMRAAQALQQKHEEIESQHSVMQHTHKVHEVNNYRSKRDRFKPCAAATLILQVLWKMHTI